MKKGFTLLELITVVVLLGLISAIIIPRVVNNVNLSRQSAKKIVIDNIENAAQRYGVQNNLGYNTEKQVLTFEQLINDGYLEDKKIIDPITEEELVGCILYHWDESSNQYIYEYSEVCE